MDDPIRPARVRLRVSDVEHSARFYSAVVGLDIATVSLEEATLSAPSGAVLLELVRAPVPGRAPKRSTGLFHTAFLFEDRAGLGAALKRAAAGQVSLTGASDHLVSEALYLDDPDGHGIELYADRPRDQWPPGEPGSGAKIAMATLPLDLGPLIEATKVTAPTPVVIGHIHLKVADAQAASDFWTERVGLELMARYGHQAVFLASGGYHHHIGANTWGSAGAEPDPVDGPGLDSIALVGPEQAETNTPDGLRVLFEPDRGGY